MNEVKVVAVSLFVVAFAAFLLPEITRSASAGGSTGPYRVKAKESVISRAGTGVTVSVSTSAWTKANGTTSLLADRSGYLVSNPAASTAVMFALCHDAAPTEAITVGAIEVGAGENPYIPCGPTLDLYLVSKHTAAENAHVLEVGQ